MVVVSENCQNYKNGAVSNQLKDVRRVGVFVGVERESVNGVQRNNVKITVLSENVSK
jgi:hypothetical protein